MMKNKLVYLILLVSLICLAGFVCLPTNIISAQGGTTIPNPLTGVTNFCQLLTKIATGVGTLIASLGVIMIIFSGILYLTSAGSPERIGVAKKALIYAIIGITIGLAATVIVEIVKEVIGATGSTC